MAALDGPRVCRCRRRGCGVAAMGERTHLPGGSLQDAQRAGRVHADGPDPGAAAASAWLTSGRRNRGETNVKRRVSCPTCPGMRRDDRGRRRPFHSRCPRMVEGERPCVLKWWGAGRVDACASEGTGEQEWQGKALCRCSLPAARRRICEGERPQAGLRVLPDGGRCAALSLSCGRCKGPSS